ncbi:hypothetical protein ALI22I_14950 [Saccharothrix sp. ALI-22-I]|uniref:condensation domain-containing protein n=1 Tax=Saccharothrix sp. ALI-22-I TaxID=1933778 RepID=UPI00097C50DF|nr:condensation domain-containing protein [Saccharothrix sp. ALI-22-I]ONI89777.1 hypothetical protein ALI22I_14950 [Saccharothrix sp. ALI-22-I]
MTTEQQVPSISDGTTRRPLSVSEEFLYAFDRGDDVGVFGPRMIVSAGWRVHGRLDMANVHLALDDVVARHEVLRTTIIRDADAPHACVHPPGPVPLTVVDLQSPAEQADRGHRAHEFLNEVDRNGRLAATETPLLRATLGRFDDDDAVLVLVANHLVSDGWSMHVIMRDFAICYATRRGLPAPELPVMRQYREYADWQRQVGRTKRAAIAREYWQSALAGGHMLTLPTDRPRRPDVPPVYSVYRFMIDRELAGASASLARSLNSSSFMVLYACFTLLLHRRTGVRDIVSPIITSGRTDPGFDHTVGALFNFLPIRTDLSGCATFADLVHRTRAALLEAYSYELPFNEIIGQSEVEMMRGPTVDADSVVTTFQLSQFPPEPAAEGVGDIRYTALRRSLVSSVDTSELPDGSLWDLDLDQAGNVAGLVKFNSLDFDQSTIVAMVDEYRELLRAALKAPDSALPGRTGGQ